jgi:hypothetical protein
MQAEKPKETKKESKKEKKVEEKPPPTPEETEALLYAGGSGSFLCDFILIFRL